MITAPARQRALDISTLFSWFIIYSYIGWVYETTYCSLNAGRFINRGFLYGPLCPIYGVAIILMILLFSRRCKSLMTLFLSCAVISTVLEYIVSMGMEYIYDNRWWDYSNRFMNINGRVCLEATVLFGVCGVLIVRFLHPAIEHFVQQNITPTNLKRINLIILAVFLFDNIVSIKMNLP